MERWRKPPVPEAVVLDDEGVDLDGNGRRVVDFLACWPQEDIGRLREGRMCLNCWEPQETPFPDACALCGYEIGKRQTEDFGRTFKGYRDTGPGSSIDQEVERMHAERERELWVPSRSIAVAKKIVKKRVTAGGETLELKAGSGIVLPNGVRGAT